MKSILPLILFFAYIECGYTQVNGGPANYWCFGGYHQVDFTNLTFNHTLNSSMLCGAAPATISDENGNLLFYSNCYTIWDASGNVMQNGILYPIANQGASFSQGQYSLIVKAPCQNDLYYFFYMSKMSTNSLDTTKLYYSVIDMSLNGGLGGVIPGQKNILIDSNIRPALAGTKHANNRDYWIVAQNTLSTTYKAWQLTPNGLITTPSISNIGYISPFNAGPSGGQLRFNNKGTKLASALSNANGNTLLQDSSSRFELMDFNRATGQLSNYIHLDFDTAMCEEINLVSGTIYRRNLLYSVEFSPNDSILYASTLKKLVQYDVSLPTNQQIASSPQVVYDATGTGATLRHIQNAPDGKMYIACSAPIHRINFPNVWGSGCDVDEDIFNYYTLGGNGTGRGFPQIMTDQLAIHNMVFLDSCQSNTIQITLTDTNFTDSCRFSFGDTLGVYHTFSCFPGLHSYALPGQYPVECVYYSGCNTDTIRDTLTIYPQPVVSLGNDTVLCEGDTIQFASNPSYSYLWSNGDSTPNIQVMLPDTYWVAATNLCNTVYDTLVVDSLIPALVHLGNDTLLCNGTNITLDASVALGSYTWQDGSALSTFLVDTPGVYHVQSSNFCAVSTDTIVVNYTHAPNINLGPDRVLCAGDTAHLFVQDTLSTYLWYSGDTTQWDTVSSPGIYWAVATNLCGSDADSVEVFNVTAPQLNLGADTILCLGDTLVLDRTIPFGSYSWSDGSTQSSLAITQQGQYWLELGNACSSVRDTIDVYYDSNPLTYLGPDSVYCLTNLQQLDATWSRATYLWNTGQTTGTITATNSGQYYVEVTNLCGYDNDTVKIFYHIPISFDLGNDTSICFFDSLPLAPIAHAATYVWNTSETDSLVYAYPAAVYSVTATNVCGSFTDSIVIGQLELPIIQSMPTSDTLCQGDVVQAAIVSPNSDKITWSDSPSSSFSRNLQQSNAYQFTLENVCGTTTDAFNLLFQPYPTVDLGPDRDICYGDVITLQVDSAATYTIEWENGSHKAIKKVIEPGTYSVTVINHPAGCTTSSEVSFEDCGGRIFIPNSFSPNGDGLNDRFVITAPKVSQFELQIFDRTGALIFYSNDINTTWDGRFNGPVVPIGAYTYKIQYLFHDTNLHTDHGVVWVME